MTPLDELRPERDDVVLIHYSAFAPRVERVLSLAGRRLLLFHNVTPSRFLWDHDPAAAVQCSLGREQLPRYVAACDAFAADSAFNAEELRAAGAETVEVLPVLADPARLGAPADPPTGPVSLLFVGRLMPHKRQDDLIRLLALYRAEHAPEATLTLVGSPLSDDYAETLRALADRLAPGAVRFERGLSPEALADRFRAAHAFVCLSEHEGFCIPVLEALHFGVPVIARPVGAIPETAGDAALLTSDDSASSPNSSSSPSPTPSCGPSCATAASPAPLRSPLSGPRPSYERWFRGRRRASESRCRCPAGPGPGGRCGTPRSAAVAHRSRRPGASRAHR